MAKSPYFVSAGGYRRWRGMKKMISLEKSPSMKNAFFARNVTVVRKCLPFGESSRGEYTHRPRYVMLHAHENESFLAINCWCGYTIFISKKHKGVLLEAPTAGRPMCATCEGKATGAGLLGSREINGRSVMFQPRGAA